MTSDNDSDDPEAEEWWVDFRGFSPGDPIPTNAPPRIKSSDTELIKNFLFKKKEQ